MSAPPRPGTGGSSEPPSTPGGRAAEDPPSTPGGRAAEERGGQSRPHAAPRRHLITGVGGQDGILLARHLLAAGEHVVGTVTREDDPRVATYLSGVQVEELDVRSTDDFAAIVRAHRPDVVHNLAALSSVGASWDSPTLTDEVNHRAVLGMLSVVGEAGVDFVQASSSEIFGPPPSVVEQPEDRGRPVETTPPPARGITEDTPLNPVSPYAEAKARAHVAVAQARAEGARVTNLILFGHTSPLHAPTFVLPTITRQAAEVALGRREAVELRDPSIARDWGSAADFVRAFALAARSSYDGSTSGDYVIATGQVHRLADLSTWALESAYTAVGREPGTTETSGSIPAGPRKRQGVSGVGRRNDFGGSYGDPTRAASELDWRPTITLRETIEQMVRADLARLRTGIQDSPEHLTW